MNNNGENDDLPRNEIEVIAQLRRVCDQLMETCAAIVDQTAETVETNNTLHRLRDDFQHRCDETILVCRQLLDKAEKTYEKALIVARDETRSKLEVIASNVVEHRREEGRHQLHEPEKDGAPVALGKLVFGLQPWRFIALLIAGVVLVGLGIVYGHWWAGTFSGDSSSTKIETHERHEPHGER